ncbi:hypothetical protein [Paludisphaera rhizosphaerae]|uniref:hypothetical protein n=1 Tax=Paludisphaera rhizosphaerae TaxID=2711216 RepID=UPI0013EA578B|nr:hypothetical protein [Paludisphaera rhizosphaerae]
MELILASPLAGVVVGLSFALALMALVAALALFAGLYYSGPRFVVKWLSRRALRVL